MKQSSRRIVYGLLVWLVPFIVASALWDPATNLPRVSMMWYGAIMNAAWALSFSVGAFYYFKKVNENFAREGIITGIAWYLLALAPEGLILVGLFKVGLGDFYPSILAYFTTLFTPMLIGYILDEKSVKKL